MDKHSNSCWHTNTGVACCGNCSGETPYCAQCGATKQPQQVLKSWMKGEEPLIKSNG